MCPSLIIKALAGASNKLVTKIIEKRALLSSRAPIAPLGSSVWIDRHRRTTSRRDGPVVDPLPSDAVGSVDELSTWRSPVLHDHHDSGVEMALGMADVG